MVTFIVCLTFYLEALSYSRAMFWVALLTFMPPSLLLFPGVSNTGYGRCVDCHACCPPRRTAPSLPPLLESPLPSIEPLSMVFG